MKLLNTLALIGNYILVLVYVSVLLNTDLSAVPVGFIVGVLVGAGIPVLSLVYLHKTRGLVKNK